MNNYDILCTIITEIHLKVKQKNKKSDFYGIIIFMTENTSPLEQESALYAELAELLKTVRNEEKQKQVKKILDSALSAAEKIHQIKDIDKSVHSSGLHFLKRKSSDGKSSADITPLTAIPDSPKEITEAESKKLAEMGIYTGLHVRAVRKNLKKSVSKVNFLTFLLTEFFPIRRFAEETEVLRMQLFPPRIRLSKTCENFFRDEIQKRAKGLMEILLTVEETGWQFLTKYEYNLVMVFKDFCSLIGSLDIEMSRSGEHGLPVKFKRLEKYFLILMSRSEHTAKISSSVEKTLVLSRKFPEVIPAALNSIKNLLTNSLSGPSLYAIILGSNIVEYKRHLTLKDILDTSRRGMINTYDFEAPFEVIKSINIYIDRRLEQLSLIVKERSKIMHLKIYLPHHQGTPYFEFLCDFMNRFETPQTVREILNEENALHFSTEYGKIILNLARSLLAGELTAMDKNFRLFEPQVFDSILSEMEFTITKLQKVYARDPELRISVTRLAAAQSRILSGIPSDSKYEMEVINDIQKAARLFYDLGAALARVLSSPVSAAVSDAPVTVSEERCGKATLPCRDCVLQNITGFIGETVLSVFTVLTQSLHLGSLFLSNPEIKSVLDNEDRLQQEYQESHDTLERIAGPDKFAAIRQMYFL